MDEFKPVGGIAIKGRIEDMPIVRFRRLYAVMLHPWFPWRLRKWIERVFISKWNERRWTY